MSKPGPSIARALGLLVLLGSLPIALQLRGEAAAAQIERVSAASDGSEGGAASTTASVSADGRFVVFTSDAANFVPNDTNGRDVFVHDRMLRTTELVSLSSGGTQANSAALFPAISGDGRYVVFESEADNLVAGDANDASDIFLRDRTAGVTRRVSVAQDGTEANDGSFTPHISANGRYVTFTSLADNLVSNDNNDDRDVFLIDLMTNAVELVSVATDGTQGDLNSGGLGAGPARVSGDGRFVVFGSFATNLVPNDANFFDDIFLRDRVAGTTERVSVATDGGEGNGHSMYGSVSDDGRFVVFFSNADNLAPGDDNGTSDVLCRDRATGETLLLSRASGGEQGDGSSRFPAISADGSTVVYQSDATNLVPEDGNGFLDVFLFDMGTGDVERVSTAAGGADPNGASSSASISRDGTVAAFQSTATNLVPGDGNGAADVFVWGKPFGAPPSPTPTATPSPSPTAPATPTRTPTPSGRTGDANGDGRVDSIDAALILQFTAEFLPSIPATADANQDGVVNAIDAALVLQLAAGLISSLPP